MDKKTIRDTIRQKLNSISDRQINDYSRNILETIKNLDVFQKAESVMIYSSIKYEPRTTELIDLCLKLGKKVYLPTIVFNEIYPVAITQSTKYYKGKFGILEPFGNVYFGDIDLTIMPMLAFDSNLNRVGKGGGYYDKFLLKNMTYKIGIGYSFMQVDEVDAKDYDVKLDAVVTENGLIVKEENVLQEQEEGTIDANN